MHVKTEGAQECTGPCLCPSGPNFDVTLFLNWTFVHIEQEQEPVGIETSSIPRGGDDKKFKYKCSIE